jgi:hypothetical protein
MSAAVLGLRTVSIEAASIETAIELDAEMSLAPDLFTKPRIPSLCGFAGAGSIPSEIL